MNWLLGLPVLVTGGAGFIGSHLVDELVAAGARVTILDNLSTGSLKNIEHLTDKITFINADIRDYAACLAVTKEIKIIFHLAAFISVPESIERPDICYQINVLGTLNLLQAAVTNGVQKFIFSSSSAVYGSGNSICTENTCCKPESPYGHSKLLGEQLCTYFSNLYPLKSLVLRYFNVYGPRQNAAGAYAAVVAKFKEAMALNKPISIYGDGTQTRDFVPVKTVAQANIKLAALDFENNVELFNVASGTSISLLDLIEQLKKEFPTFNAELQFLPAREGDIKHSQADCSKFNPYKILPITP
jgi:UDP-glucose 4-epimerase